MARAAAVRPRCRHHHHHILLLFLLLLAVASTAAAKKQAKLRVGVTEAPAGKCDTKAITDSRITVALDLSVLPSDEGAPPHFLREEALTLTLGRGQVIKGLDQGLIGMCEGEKRKIVIPPHLGYGEIGAGQALPPKATLLANVHALKIERNAEASS